MRASFLGRPAWAAAMRWTASSSASPLTLWLVSAEHGVGPVRRAAVRRYKPPVEIELMKRSERTD